MSDKLSNERDSIEYAIQVLQQVEAGDGTFVGQCADAIEGLEAVLAASPAPAIPAEPVPPFGWVQPRGGNYFTRSELSAKRVGGLIPVWTTASAISESEDTKRLDFLAAESADLVSFAIPYEDDADIGWRVLSHHMREPMPRVIGEVFRDDPRAAIDAARKGGKS